MTAFSSSRLGGLVLAALAGAAAAGLLARTSAPPAADVLRGTEDAFVRGLHLREIPPRGQPQRWTRERTVVSFRHLPSGPATVDVALRGQRGPVLVAADGVVLGSLDPGARYASFQVPAGAQALREIELRSNVFVAGDGRQLGALFERVTVRTERARWPSAGLVVLLAIPAIAIAGLAGLAGWGGWAAGAFGVAMAAFQAALLRPNGVVHSPYAAELALLLVGAGLACGAWGALWDRRRSGSGPWAFAALLAAVLVQVAVGASPLMVVSDAVFHANNLARVSGGDFFLTSVTQHETPFRFPYGVSFYVLLAPLLRAGLDPVALVRWGAGLAGVAAAAAWFGLLVARGPRLAAVAVVVLQLLPGTIEVLSFGNLSNAFAQGVTILFFAWWAGRARGSAALGALLFAVAATAHLSAFIVLAALAPWMIWSRWADLRSDRPRALALAAGLVAAGLYYASFTSLVMAQLGRLGEGGGPAGPGILAVFGRQAATLAGQWGVPVILLAIVGRPRPARGAFDRDLTAWWGAGLLLLALSLATPLDVRWAYGLGAAAATAAGFGAAWLWSSGRAGRAAAVVLLAAHGLLGIWSAATAHSGSAIGNSF